MKEIRKRGSYRLKKQILSALLSAVVIVGIFSGCRNGLAEQTAPTQSTFPTQKQESTVQDILEHGASVSEEKAEMVRARELGLIPQEWEKDLSNVTGILYKKAYEFGGLASGEHGIGLSKQIHYQNETPSENLALMNAIKKAFDPNGILNSKKSYLFRD